MPRGEKKITHEDLCFPPHGSPAGPNLGACPGHNRLLVGPRAELVVFLFFIKKKSQMEAPKLPPARTSEVHTPDPEGSRRGGARPQQLGGRSLVLSSRRCRPRSAVWPQPAPPLGRAAPSPLPFSAGRAIRVGPPSCGVITADLKADDVPREPTAPGQAPPEQVRGMATSEPAGCSPLPLSRAPRPGPLGNVSAEGIGRR